MTNILVTGSSGQLGSEFREISSGYTYNFFFTDRQILDIIDVNSIKNFIEINKINIIINSAAYTSVDKSENDKESVDLVNHISVKNLAQIAKEKNIKLIHISTDYVFDGKKYKPYVENDPTNPNGVYGKTKLDGEKVMQDINPKNSIIIRTSWLYSSFGNNFVKTMINLGRNRDSLGVIFDQLGTPTYARDLAKTTLDIIPNISNEKVETYHYSNEGVCSWYDFAKEIMDLANIDCIVNPIETKDYPTPASRPHYSLLNKSKIKKEFNIIIPYWKYSLKACLIKMGDIK